MKLNAREKLCLRKLKAELYSALPIEMPDLYEELKNEAEWTKLNKNKNQEYTPEEMFKILAERKIQDALRKDLEYAKSVMERDVDECPEKDLEELLRVLFYFGCKGVEEFYRKNKLEKDSIKSIHAQIKQGKFVYNYEAYFIRLLEIANMYREKYQIDISNNDELLALSGFYNDILYKSEKRVRKVFEIGNSYDDIIRKIILELWYVNNQMALEHMETLEKKNENLLYVYYYWGVIQESVGKILWQVQKWGAYKREKKYNFKAFYNNVLLDIKNLRVKKHYDIIQNYGIHHLMYNARYERRTWIAIIRFLYSEIQADDYRDYNGEYSVIGLEMESLEPKELMLKFCEGSTERKGSFEKKFNY